ncbi:MAG: hypothetical protein A3J63_02625 [Candidatus Moranbacteria bacterium RIFCSPHIGHO2_02_FULL_40_12b]|nr:MAG: hypothetical protein A3J63_02625 [Candidatus Moranbacteria bacterium RIFCSPHIGHO2_02_FULL_40_12b]OGI24074.1 MAG: hypothetical protein A3E91_00275 [Candidatus Moranbacteria bacterium RIFCSPHIGHO2_12_FULL_40_10]
MKKFKNCLRDKAFNPENSQGRRNDGKDEDSPYFNCVDPFILSRDKVLNSKARRRLNEKTQVLCDPRNPHIRTRSRHTMEVVSIATKIADITGLNIPLCEAIAEAHDIGHTPFGHLGEEFISKVSGKKFSHEVFGIVIAQHIERKGEGLNLNFEVLEGVLNHSRGGKALLINPESPLEYAVAMFSDKIAYTFSDINDGLRYGHIEEAALPREVNYLGKNQRERILHCIFTLVRESSEKGIISFSESEAAEKFGKIRDWMYENYYSQLDWRIQKMILERVFEFLQRDHSFRECDPSILLALMTDTEINQMAKNIYLHGKKPRIEDIKNFGITEIIPHIREKNIDFADPDLDWVK